MTDKNVPQGISIADGPSHGLSDMTLSKLFITFSVSLSMLLSEAAETAERGGFEERAKRLVFASESVLQGATEASYEAVTGVPMVFAKAILDRGIQTPDQKPTSDDLRHNLGYL